MEKLEAAINLFTTAKRNKEDVYCLPDSYITANMFKWLKELKSYKDLEEQGLLVRLPCKVGTEVYYILGIPNKTPCTIDKCAFKLSDVHKIGESLFLTREEAEKKLKEMKNGL